MLSEIDCPLLETKFLSWLSSRRIATGFFKKLTDWKTLYGEPAIYMSLLLSWKPHYSDWPYKISF